MKGKSKSVCLWIILGLLFLFIVVPVGLNYVLRIQVPTPVIGGEDSEKVWLAFWGAYLSALGSFIMAFVSFLNNRKNAVQSFLMQKTTNTRKYLLNLEVEMIRNETLHSILQATKIYRLACTDPKSAIQANIIWCQRLKDATLRFLKIQNAHEQDVNNYYHHLRSASSFYVDLNEKIDVIIHELEPLFHDKGGAYKNKLVEFDNLLNGVYLNASDMSEKLSDAGFELLHSRYHSLVIEEQGITEKLNNYL